MGLGLFSTLVGRDDGDRSLRMRLEAKGMAPCFWMLGCWCLFLALMKIPEFTFWGRLLFLLRIVVNQCLVEQVLVSSQSAFFCVNSEDGFLRFMVT